MYRYCLLVLFFYGCSFQVPELREIDFSQLETYRVKAAKINVIDQSNEASSDNVDLVLLPQYAINNWISARLKADGPDINTLRVTIEKSNISAKIISHGKKGISANFYDDQIAYTINLEVIFEYFGEDLFFPLKEMKISLNHTKSIEQGKTLYEKKLLCHELVKEAMEDFNKKFDSNFANYFAHIINL
jgi:hypothetical protein